jgi:hypothetical protein
VPTPDNADWLILGHPVTSIGAEHIPAIIAPEGLDVGLLTIAKQWRIVRKERAAKAEARGEADRNAAAAYLAEHRADFPDDDAETVLTTWEADARALALIEGAAILHRNAVQAEAEKVEQGRADALTYMLTQLGTFAAEGGDAWNQIAERFLALAEERAAREAEVEAEVARKVA